MEFMENVFDAMCSAVSEPDIKELFLKSEGVDLMVLMMKYARSPPAHTRRI
jgi:beta-catenin-like protein 1